MPSLQIITMLITPDSTGLNISPFISNYNNVLLKDLDKYQNQARSAAQATLKPGGYSLPNQTVIVAEEIFPCYDKI